MFCPQCGAENEAGNQFCVSCGSSLSIQRTRDEKSPPPSLRTRLGALLGETRRARFVTAATLAAIAIAVIAFIALDSADGDEDAYLQRVDRICVEQKERVSQLEQETLVQAPPNVAEFASVLVAIVAEWRSILKEEPAPRIHAVEIEELDAALREVLIEAGGLARLSRVDSPPASIGTQAAAVDAATASAGKVIGDLGLSACSELSVSPAAPAAQ